MAVCAQVDKPWPVDVMDHQGVWHSIPLVPGEMALYEGASCPHGRPVRFRGPSPRALTMTAVRGQATVLRSSSMADGLGQ